MTSAEDFYHRAVELFDQREYRLADDLSRQGLQVFPDDGRLWQLHGCALWNLRDYPGAIAALETAGVLMPLYPLARCALADSYRRTGQDEAARTEYAFLAEDEQCPTPLLPSVAAGLGALGDHLPALAVCEKIVERQPDHHAAHFGIAYYRGRLKYPAAEVIPPLATAHDLAPHILHYRVNLAFALARAGRYAEAAELVRHVPLEAVRCPCWLRRLAAIHAAAGDQVRREACEERISRLSRP